MKTLKDFIKSEQELNNYDLYKNNKQFDGYFSFNIPSQFLPSSQNKFKLPYFLIPKKSNEFYLDKTELSFFNKNLFIGENLDFYKFFIHPSTKENFLNWLKDKYVA